jgi:hypothetical protein
MCTHIARVVAVLLSLPCAVLASGIDQGVPVTDPGSELRVRAASAAHVHDVVLHCTRAPNNALECNNVHQMASRVRDGTCVVGTWPSADTYRLVAPGRWRSTITLAGCTNLSLETELAFDDEHRVWTRTQRQIENGTPRPTSKVAASLNCDPDPPETFSEPPTGPISEPIACTGVRLDPPELPPATKREPHSERHSPPPVLVLEYVEPKEVGQSLWSCSETRPHVLECTGYYVALERDDAGTCHSGLTTPVTKSFLEAGGAEDGVWRATSNSQCPDLLSSTELSFRPSLGGWTLTYDTYEALHAPVRTGRCLVPPWRREAREVPRGRSRAVSPVLRCSSVTFGFPVTGPAPDSWWRVRR